MPPRQRREVGRALCSADFFPGRWGDVLNLLALAVVGLAAAAAPVLLAPEGASLIPGAGWVTDEDANAIGKRIWHNESGGKLSGLTHWNAGEDFASLGIGHFIWYPAGAERPFQESFTKLLAYLEGHGIELPTWLKDSPRCPWPDRESFLRDQKSPRMRELRSLMASTVDLQARYMADRLQVALPRVLKAAPRRHRRLLRRRFDTLAEQSDGLYALVDYVNFKGEGTGRQERYGGKGWGLLQALLFMRGEPEEEAALREFSRATARVLARRVRNSPPERGESRWLAGWRKRVRSYSPVG